MDIGLLLLRLAIGLTLAAHGAQKLFGWFGGPGLEGTAQGLGALGFHPARRQAWLAGLAEAAGGVLLTLGFLTPLGAAVALAVMIVAAISVHLKNGFFSMAGGYELNFVIGAAVSALAFTGPGALSLDAVLGLSQGHLGSGIAAHLIGIIGAIIPLARRRSRLEQGQIADAA
jgi:putative oxidoreductase